MKHAWILGSLALISGLAATVQAAPPDLKATAETLVNQCASIKQGDIVLISGRTTDTELLENIAVGVRKLGGFPLITTWSDRLSRRMYDEVPAQFDTQTDPLDLKLAAIATAMISVDSVENPALFADAAPARLAARAKARQPVMEAMLKNNVRQVSLGNGLFPTAATAKQYGLTQEQLATIFWSGVNTDYSKLQNTGETVRAALAAGRKVHITNPNGTDITFSTLGPAGKTFASDGVISADDLKQGGAACQVWLPAGEVYTACASGGGGADGKVVVDHHFFQGKEITGLTLTFKGGKVTGLTAKSGLEPLKAAYDAAGEGKDILGFIDIGINPDVKIPAGSKLNSWIPAGTVTLGLGGNTWAGGANNCPFDMPLFLPGSTLTVDGKTLVDAGTLKP